MCYTQEQDTQFDVCVNVCVCVRACVYVRVCVSVCLFVCVCGLAYGLYGAHRRNDFAGTCR